VANSPTGVRWSSLLITGRDVYNSAMNSDIPRLLGILSDHAARKRVEAAEQLAQLGPDARPAAVALVLACGDEDDEVRQCATAALEGIGPPEASDVEQLASFLEGRSPDVGYWAATLLGRLKGKGAAAVDALARAVAGSPHLSVRQRAAWALGEIGPAAVAAVPCLKKATADPDPRLSRLAQEAIGQIAGR
jgi:HEAT repeat protein